MPYTYCNHDAFFVFIKKVSKRRTKNGTRLLAWVMVLCPFSRRGLDDVIYPHNHFCRFGSVGDDHLLGVVGFNHFHLGHVADHALVHV